MLPSFLTPTSLPDQDKNPDQRARSLARAQDEYTWDWSWPPGCATARKLPDGDDYALTFVAHIAKISAAVSANHAALALDGVKQTAPAAPPSSPADLARSFFEAAELFHEGAPRTRPARADHYAQYFARFAAPPLVARQTAHPSEADDLFAWQRVGGANPMALRRLTRLPDDFPLDEARWTAAVGDGSLAAALGQGHLFAVDFTLLHGAPATRYLGRQKYLCGARGVFTTHAARGVGPLRPVAIQLEPGGPLFTPSDGAAWRMARYFLQVADANVHETQEHLGRTHMVLEAAGVSARRQLAPEHPLRRLLEPHLVGTFAINRSAKTSLIAPEGVIDRVFAARIDVAAGLVRASLDGFSLQDCAPARELRARGVDDPETLPGYPYRDDIVRVYSAIERFVGAYVRAYYDDDATVARDVELRAWVAEVASPLGGALRNVRPVETLAALTEWMTNLIHLASAQHAAVNFPQYPFFSWGESVGGACWGPPPSDAARATDADLLSLMPPWDCLILQADTVYQLSSVHYNRLGDYGLFFGHHVEPALERFQDDLATLDRAIADADPDRRLSYPFLRPSLIPASINI